MVVTTTLLSMLMSTSVFADDVTTIENGTEVTDITGTAGSLQYFMIDIPDTAQTVSISISGEYGDADLYVKAGAKPTFDDYDCRPYLWGSHENCLNITASNVPYYIMVHAYQDYSELTLIASYSETAAEKVSNTDCALTDVQQSLLDAHNNARSTGRYCGSTYYEAAPALTWNCQLATAATSHSTDMAENNFISHTGSDGSNPGDRISAAGYSYSTYGENVAAGYTTADSALAGWLSSAGHCANIMNATFTEMGADKISNTAADYVHYWTGVFGDTL